MIIVKKLGLVPYKESFNLMKQFTQQRPDSSFDEIWSLQHPQVFTQGQAGKKEHLLFSNDIPVIQSDRGGQITYHGPGQLVIYPLLKLKIWLLLINPPC